MTELLILRPNTSCVFQFVAIKLTVWILFGPFFILSYLGQPKKEEKFWKNSTCPVQPLQLPISDADTAA